MGTYGCVLCIWEHFENYVLQSMYCHGLASNRMGSEGKESETLLCPPDELTSGMCSVTMISDMYTHYFLIVKMLNKMTSGMPGHDRSFQCARTFCRPLTQPA